MFSRAASRSRPKEPGQIGERPDVARPGDRRASLSKRSSWTSRSRTAPRSSATQPNSFRSRRASAGQHTGEQSQSGPEPPGGHPHVVQLLDVLSEPGPGLVGQHRSEVAAQDGVGDGADRGFGAERGRSPGRGPGGTCRPAASSPTSNFDRIAGWRPHSRRSWSTRGVSRSTQAGLGLDLDPAHPDRILVVAHHDDGVVEIDFAENARRRRADSWGRRRVRTSSRCSRGALTGQGPQAPTYRSL